MKTAMNTELKEEPGRLETDAVLVRTMCEQDLESVVAIDAASSARRRPRYFQLMLERSVKQAALQISLAAELDGRVVGFLIGSLYYGEYGVTETSASLDAIGVHPDYRRRHVGHALMRQLRLNMQALRIGSLRTEVAWSDFDLLAFLQRQGFSPAGRICLECGIDPTAPGD
jgi:ribosomal protein S18 acetylase RimI-like enzyme